MPQLLPLKGSACEARIKVLLPPARTGGLDHLCNEAKLFTDCK